MKGAESAITVSGLTKRFGSTVALDEFDLEVSTGEVHGFLGPNGAGKSTAIRVLLGLLRKDSGDVKVLGGDPWHDAVKLHKRLAYVPGDVELWPGLSGGETIDLLGALRGGLNKTRRAELIEMFQLDPTKKCRTYSKGNRQKVALIAALASDVELYLMDEPTAGLDPLMEALFREQVNDLRKQGKTVLLSSHILAEAEALCDRITIIREGKTVQTGTLAELRHLKRLHVTVDTKKQINGLKNMPGVHNAAIEGTHAEFEAEPKALDGVLHNLADLHVTNFVSAPPSLEQLFMRHYSDETPAANGEKKER